MRCPCRKVSEPVDYDACCGPLHAGSIAAPSALALMRARYAAYALANIAFVRDTWHPTTRPRHLEADPPGTWISLKIQHASETASEATVSFVARSRRGGRTSVLAETSRFRHEDGRWLYVDGTIEPDGGSGPSER